jgi:hypothetical protein
MPIIHLLYINKQSIQAKCYHARETMKREKGKEEEGTINN